MGDVVAVASHASPVRTRTAEPGAPITLAILASGQRGGIAVDLDSGALVRARYLTGAPFPLRPFDVVAASVARRQDDPDPTRPEALVVEGFDEQSRCGRLRGRAARRVLRDLVQPARGHLLGVAGPAVPFWTMTAATRPSVALVEPASAPVVTAAPTCRFGWAGQDHELPLQDRRLAAIMSRTGQTRLSGAGLARVLGDRPSYLLVALTPPCDGHCYKVVAGILPRP